MEEKYIWIVKRSQPTAVGTENLVSFIDKDRAINFIKILLGKVDEIIDIVGDYTIVDCIETGIPTCYYLERCIIR